MSTHRQRTQHAARKAGDGRGYAECSHKVPQWIPHRSRNPATPPAAPPSQTEDFDLKPAKIEKSRDTPRVRSCRPDGGQGCTCNAFHDVALPHAAETLKLLTSKTLGMARMGLVRLSFGLDAA